MAAFLSWVVSNVVLAGLLSALAFLAGRSFKSPHLSHGLWVLVLLKLLTPPIFVWETSWFQEPMAPSEESVASASIEALPITQPVPPPLKFEADVLPPLSDETTSDRMPTEENMALEPLDLEPEPGVAPSPIGMTEALVVAWLLGAVLCGGLVVVRCLRFRRLLALADPAEEFLQAEALQVSNRMGLKRCPRIDSIDASIPPLVWGLMGRPRILLPRKLALELTLVERQAVLAHELAHIWRKDHFIRWIEVCALVLFWWYPVAWWASRELRRAEEECCDALVIWALPKSRHAYALALCKTMEFLAEARLPIPAVAGGTLGGPALKRRITMILNQKVSHRMSWKARIAMLLVGAVALPIMAQNATSERPRPTDEPKADAPAPPANLPGEEEKPEDPTEDPSAIPAPRNVPDVAALWKEGLDASLEPFSNLKISSLHSGTILNVHVSLGDLVKEGQILVDVRNTEMEIRLEETRGELKVQEEKTEAAKVAIRLAQATLEQAKAEYTRAEEIMKRAAGSISQAEFEQLRIGLQQAELSVQKAELEERASTRTLATLQKRAELAARLVEELSIKAPSEGVVLKLFAQAGEAVRANDPVANIVRLSPLIATTLVQNPEGLLGQDVLVDVMSSKDQVRTFPAKITFVSPIVDPVTQKVQIRCAFKNAGPDGQPLVRPGQSASIRLPKKR
jgi:beta-lactamase regulating signal transducer with metallopeptidase domain